jgi:hypothetical protein
LGGHVVSPQTPLPRAYPTASGWGIQKIIINNAQRASKIMKAQSLIGQNSLKYQIMFIATRTKLILENVLIWFMYVLISFCDRANYWAYLVSYRINRAIYWILEKKI